MWVRVRMHATVKHYYTRLVSDIKLITDPEEIDSNECEWVVRSDYLIQVWLEPRTAQLRNILYTNRYVYILNANKKM